MRNNFGGQGLGDTNDDGNVDLDDLNAVRNNFGASAAPLTASGSLLEKGVVTAKDESFDPFLFERRPLDGESFNAAVDRVHEAEAVAWQRWQEATGFTESLVDKIFATQRKSRRLITI